MLSYILGLDKIPYRVNFFEKLLHKNGYPENFIDNCFNNFLDNVHLFKENQPTMEKKRLLLVLLSLKTRTKL